MAPVGVRAHPDDIVVTAGSQMALDLVVRVFCDPGDVVLVEAPTYVTALGVFSAYQCEVVHVPMDERGPAARRAARGDRGGARAGQADQARSTRSRRSTTPPASRRGRPGGPRSSRSPARDGHAAARGRPLRPARVRRHRCRGRSAPTRPRASSTSAPSPRPSPPGCASAGRVAPHGVREKLVLANETATLCPSQLHPADDLRVPRHAAVVRPGQGVPRGLPRAARRAARVARRAHARGHAAGPCPPAASTRWVTLPARSRRHGDAAARGRRPRRLRARHRLLRRRPGPRSRCGCRTATPSPTGSARACAGSPGSSRPSWRSRRRSAAPHAVSGATGPRPRRPDLA